MDVTSSTLGLLTALGVRYPDLRRFSISINTYDWQEGFLQCLSSLVCKLTRAEHLALHGLDHAMLEHIGRLHTLKSLIVRRPEPLTSDGSSAAQSNDPLFPSLEYLHLDEADAAFTIALVQRMARAPITSITTLISAYPESTYLVDLCAE
ncbi:hypothetical protein B0H16DRAFT_1742316 [Mycena metata]|uniref:Uncharacterized protein n=1 Tax=Mycena metata TaxID=1033252 RepID=A0AAD7H921_9AGAR|nr:hypothetical protein B0H16DRAFT_1742316 [Mycena metata]